MTRPKPKRETSVQRYVKSLCPVPLKSREPALPKMHKIGIFTAPSGDKWLIETTDCTLARAIARLGKGRVK